MSSKDEIIELYPEMFRNSPQYQAIAQAEGKQFDKLEAAIEDVLNQTFIDTSTWGLALWEKDFGIPTNTSKPIEERRSNLKAKKRGIGTVKEDVIKNTAEAYYGGEVEVIPKPRDLELVVKFISSYGIPRNLDDVRKALEEIIPAHLELLFEFTYLLIKDIHNVKTLNEMEQIPLNKFAGGAF
ncbi:YmfQ family protein [Parageobacillus thermoglucosidasius]|uniref:YmfQ family protein n=1 Tax=Parageobacillus thermoglucosidasius TaxID=1426 RepID=UPI00025B7BA2|nr:YmfQ family protein [Parageobacillus thermoglucosidasius]EID42848.1 phage-like element pbsx protein xkdT [Parageobacillus thermoglucosidasius TNO-09.020]